MGGMGSRSSRRQCETHLLVGNLRLENATRKYLEAHNVTVIDLAPLVKDLLPQNRHAAATRLFFEELRRAKPVPSHEWKRTPHEQFPLTLAGANAYQRVHKDAAFTADLLEKTIPLLKADRMNYPGWLVCPAKYRLSLGNSGGEDWLLRKPVLDLLKPEVRAEVLFEILWRRLTAFDPLEPELVSAMKEMVDAKPPEIDPELRLRFAVALTRQARVSYNDADLKRWADLIEAEAIPDAPERQQARYQLCLRARDRMDMDGMTGALERITAETPIWKLRRAALHIELGEHAKATKLIREAAADLEKWQRLDRNSLSIKSQLAWAQWNKRASEAWDLTAKGSLSKPYNFEQFDIDPLGEIEYIESKAKDIGEKQREREAAIEPSFDAGTYRDSSRTIHFGGDPALGIWYEFDQLIEFVGLPIRINHANICAEAAISVVTVARQSTVEWYVWLLRALHSHFDSPFKRYFGRVAIAQMKTDLGAKLVSTIEATLPYWTTRLKDARGTDLKYDSGCALDRLRLLVMVLSRLTVRMPEDQALRTFYRALELSKDPLIWQPWLLEACGELAKYSVDAISFAQRGMLARAVIEFPLATEKGTQDRFWPQLVTAIWESTPTRDMTDARWDIRIHQLIAAAEKGQAARPEAILRLAYLAVRNALKSEEASAFGRALWSDLDGTDNALPLNTSLLSVVFVELPAPDGIDVQARVRTRLFGADLREVMTLTDFSNSMAPDDKLQHLASLANATRPALTMPSATASRMFDEIVVWEQQTSSRTDPFAASIVNRFNDGVRRTIGQILTLVVVPVMETYERTDQRARSLIDFIARTRSWTSLGALPYFVASAPAVANDVVSAIRGGLVSSEFQRVAGAATAIECWAKLVRDGILHELPRSLIDQLIAVIETRQMSGLQATLRTASILLKDNFFTGGDLERLKAALAEIRVQFFYESVENLESIRAVSISLVRAACVKLAAMLKDRINDDETLQAWLDEAKTDPLPEVRFAVADFLGPPAP